MEKKNYSNRPTPEVGSRDPYGRISWASYVGTRLWSCTGRYQSHTKFGCNASVVTTRTQSPFFSAIINIEREFSNLSLFVAKKNGDWQLAVCQSRTIFSYGVPQITSCRYSGDKTDLLCLLFKREQVLIRKRPYPIRIFTEPLSFPTALRCLS